MIIACTQDATQSYPRIPPLTFTSPQTGSRPILGSFTRDNRKSSVGKEIPLMGQEGQEHKIPTLRSQRKLGRAKKRTALSLSSAAPLLPRNSIQKGGAMGMASPKISEQSPEYSSFATPMRLFFPTSLESLISTRLQMVYGEKQEAKAW